MTVSCSSIYRRMVDIRNIKKKYANRSFRCKKMVMNPFNLKRTVHHDFAIINLLFIEPLTDIVNLFLKQTYLFAKATQICILFGSDVYVTYRIRSINKYRCWWSFNWSLWLKTKCNCKQLVYNLASLQVLRTFWLLQYYFMRLSTLLQI